MCQIITGHQTKLLNPAIGRMIGQVGDVVPRSRNGNGADRSLESVLRSPNRGTPDDNELVNLFLAGQHGALAEIFERHKVNVFRTARRILGNESEAEETVQQVFLELQGTMGQFDPTKSAFKTWLLRKTTFRAINRKAYLRSHAFYSSEELTDDLSRVADDTILGLSEQEVSCLVNELLNELDPEELEIIELVYFEGLTLDEVVLRTGKNLGAVRYRLAKGLEVVRTAFLSRSKDQAAKPEELP